MSDILIGVIVFGLVFSAAIFGMFLGRNLRVLEQKVNASELSDADKFDCNSVKGAWLPRSFTLSRAVTARSPRSTSCSKQGRPVPNQRSGQAERLKNTCSCRLDGASYRRSTPAYEFDH